MDWTPDICHTDQLTCIRYGKDGSIVERFLGFIAIHSHMSVYLTDIALNYFKDNEIDIKKSRGQSNDTAYNISGSYSGLQSRIRQVNEHAMFIPCSAHSLN